MAQSETIPGRDPPFETWLCSEKEEFEAGHESLVLELPGWGKSQHHLRRTWRTKPDQKRRLHATNCIGLTHWKCFVPDNVIMVGQLTSLGAGHRENIHSPLVKMGAF